MTAILLIDVAHLFHQSWHATEDKEVGEAFSRTLEKVAQIRGRVEHTHCVICCDHAPYWRHDLDQKYKAHRAKPTEAMVEQFARVRERLAREPLLVWRFKGYEADDVIGTACRIATERGHRVVIASGDKDLMQCVSDTVSLFSTSSFSMLGPADVQAKFGVVPSQMVELLALWGDSGDNVPGIPGVGAKKAAQLLSMFPTGVAAIAAAREGDMRIPKALTAALVEHYANYGWALQLVAVKTDVPLDYDEIFQERKPEPIAEESEMAEDFEDAELISPAPGKAPSEPPPASAEVVAITPIREAHQAIQRAVSFELGLEPTTLGQAVKLSGMLEQSRLYTRFPNSNAIAAVIIRGREMGMGALTSLDCFHVIEGKPAPGAHLIISKARQHPDCEYFQQIESTSERATYETKSRRNPRPTTHTYTLDDAKRAGMCPAEPRLRNPDPKAKDDRNQWEKRPAEMLRKTCAVQLARIEYPEATLGLVAIEELGGEE